MQLTLSPGLIDKSELVGQIIMPTRRRKRFLNYFIDAIFYNVIYSVISLFTAYIILSGEIERTTTPSSQLVDTFLNILFMIVYYIFFEYKFGKTIGKMITNTKVVRKDGTKPTLSNIIGRSFARIIPFEPFSMIGAHLPVGWHDSMTDTLVVDDISLYNIEKKEEKLEESY